MASQLSRNFLTPNRRFKNLGRLQRVLGEGFKDTNGVFIHQKKNVIDMLQETRLMDAKPAETPLETSLQPNQMKESCRRMILCIEG